MLTRTKTFEGKVFRIAPMGVEKDNVTRFEVRVSILNDIELLKANMSANAEIVLEEHPNVLLIPESALIYNEKRDTSVEIPDPSSRTGRRQVSVKIGLSNGSRAEVLGWCETWRSGGLAVARSGGIRVMDLIRQTWMTLTANKTRSFLTMFGIAWGLICLILMTAIGEGMWVAQKQKARSLGQNILIVWGGITSKGGEGVRPGRDIRLTLDDYFTLKREASYLIRLSPEIERYLPVRSSINNGSFGVHGVFPDYMLMRTIDVQPNGRIIHEGDNSGAQRVCILGDEVKDQLFNKTQAVGKTVNIGGYPYLVIGELVHKDQNSNYSGPDAKMIYVPFYTIAKDFPLDYAVRRKVSALQSDSATQE